VNPFNEQLLEEFRGERVRARSPAFDAPVRGYLRVPHFDDGAVLHGATSLPADDGDPGEHLGTSSSGASTRSPRRRDALARTTERSVVTVLVSISRRIPPTKGPEKGPAKLVSFHG
jgi:hypothetical protein